jgi:phosphatidylinositol-3-phosphatase
MLHTALAATAVFAVPHHGPVAMPRDLREALTPPVHHLFIIVLENESYDRTFGPRSRAPYLSRTLVSQGGLLRQYYGIGHASLDNYIAMISGQAPNQATQLDCSRFTEFHATRPSLNADGQAMGTGCLYPTAVHTIADQLDAAHMSWKAYMEDMGNNPHREPVACAHPQIDATDHTEGAQRGDQYATKHDPFVYFHSIIDDPAHCAAHVVNLRQLAGDLATAATTPQYTFITPNLCDDGHDEPCVDGAPGGLVQADRFLQRIVPLITASPAYRADGVLIITFDEASGGSSSDLEACCNERGLPGQRRQPGWDGPGGGRVGAVVLSPFVRAGTISDVPYNHYALLRWTEDVFALPRLGYAAQAGLATFGSDVFNPARLSTAAAAQP